MPCCHRRASVHQKGVTARQRQNQQPWQPTQPKLFSGACSFVVAAGHASLANQNGDDVVSGNWRAKRALVCCADQQHRRAPFGRGNKGAPTDRYLHHREYRQYSFPTPGQTKLPYGEPIQEAALQAREACLPHLNELNPDRSYRIAIWMCCMQSIREHGLSLSNSLSL